MIEIPQNNCIDQDFFFNIYINEYFSSNSFSKEVGIVRCVPCRHGSIYDCPISELMCDPQLELKNHSYEYDYPRYMKGSLSLP